MVLVDEEKVVKVAADLPRGVHRGVDVEVRTLGEGREDTRQHRGLDARGHGQLGADAFFFGGDGLVLADVILHALRQRRKGVRQGLRLVACVERPVKVKVVALHRADLLGQLSDGPHDLPRERHGHGQRDQHRRGQQRQQPVLRPHGIARRVAEGRFGHRVDAFEQAVRRGLHGLLRQKHDHRPADGLHRRVCRVARRAVDVQQRHALPASYGPLGHFGQRRVRRQAQIRRVDRCGERAALIGRKQHLPAPVEDAGVAAAAQIHAADQILHVVEIHARAGHGDELPAAIDRHSAHDAQTGRVGVPGHGSEEGSAARGRADVPGALLRLQGHELPVLVKLFRGDVVGLHHEARLRRHVKRGDVVLASVHSHQRVLHVADQLQFPDDRGVLRVDGGGIEHLDGQLAVL